MKSKLLFLGMSFILLTGFTDCKHGSFHTTASVSGQSDDPTNDTTTDGNSTTTTTTTTTTLNTGSGGTNGVCGTASFSCLSGTPADGKQENGVNIWACLGLNGGQNAYNCQAVTSVNEAINGACGTTSSSCLHGTTPANQNQENGTWSCLGLNGGQDVHNCQVPAANRPINGVCGATSFTCLHGTTPANGSQEDGFNTWSCLGLNGGLDIHTCRQAVTVVNQPINGECHSTNFYSCLNGTYPSNAREENGYYKWSCLGLNGGQPIHSCQQLIPVSAQPAVHGECGTEQFTCLNNTKISNKRTETENGFHKWSCMGLHGGNNIHTCQFAIPPQAVNGVCDLSTRYACLNGTTSHDNREIEGYYLWSCLGLHRGADIHSCRKKAPPKPVDGQCHQTDYYSCLNNTSVKEGSEREVNGLYKWTCEGLHRGQDEACELAVPPISTPVEMDDQFEVTQVASRQKVDILMVVDESGSMYKYQQKLGKRFGNLTSNIGGVDWQMAFINDNPNSSARMTTILSPSTPQVQKEFVKWITNPPGYSTQAEYPLTNIKRVITTTNTAFLRQDASLATIILTNEGSDTVTAQQVLNALKNKFGDTKRLFVYAIIPNRDDGYLRRIRELIRRTGGIEGNLKAASYASILTEMSRNLGEKLSLKTIPLRYEGVIAQSVSLTFTPASNTLTDWRYDSQTNQIIFETLPSAGTTVRVSYKYEE